MILAYCVLVTFVLEVSDAQTTTFYRDISFRELIDKSPNCKLCTADWKTTPAFCNIFAIPTTNYKIKIGGIYEENVMDDPCYCGRVGSIFYAKDPTLPACTRVPNICETLKKDVVCGASKWTCNGEQWSTFHCSCPKGLQGQLCNVPSGAGQVVKSPILVHYLYTPLFQKQLLSEIQLLPGLYFITESFGDDFSLIVDFEDGRRIQITPSLFTTKDYRRECLTDINEKIHFISRHHCNMIPAGNVHGYGIFLDEMIRVNLDSPENLVPTNESYSINYKSAGRFGKLNIQVKNKGQVTWKWDTFEVFVPYQRFFLACAKNIQIHGCGDEHAAPIMKSVYLPIVLRASHTSWSEVNCDQLFKDDDHRWFVEKVNSDKFSSWIPGPKLPEKYSQGVEGNTRTIDEGVLGEGKYVVTYDYIQQGTEMMTPSQVSHVDTLFVIRKLCYFEVVKDSTMKVYFHTRRMSVRCDQLAIIDVENYNSYYYDGERFSITWTCEGSTSSECRVTETKGLHPTYPFEIKCDLKYKYTAKVTHPKTTAQLVYQIEISTEGWKSTVKIQCVEGCGYKIKADEYLYLQASENPSNENSWTWEIREVTRSDSDGHETEGPDLVGNMRVSNTDENILIAPHNKMENGKEYRAYARTPTGYSSYTFMTNKPPEGGTCSVDPQTGVSLETDFRITCSAWQDDDLPLRYRVMEVPDTTRPKEVEPLVTSESSVIENLKLRRKNINVMISDSEESFATYSLTVMLSKNTKPINEESIKESITDIIRQLRGGAQLPALTAIDELTKLVEDKNLQISENTLLELLNVLGGIYTFDEAPDLETALLALNRIMSLKTEEPKKLRDKLLLQGSEQLREYAQNLDNLYMSNKLNMIFDKEILASSISKSSCKILLEKDPVIEQDTASETIHEEHKERIKKATDNSLHSMAALGLFLTKSVRYQYPKYTVRKDCFQILSKYTNGSEIPNELDDKVSFPGDYYKNESINVGVISMNEGTLWGVPNDIGLLGVIARFPNITNGENESIVISLTVPNYHNQSKTVEGRFKPPIPCPSDTKLDKNFNVHHFTLPDGEGVVILNFSSALIGKTRVFAEQRHKPSHADVASKPILNSTDGFFTFSNRDHALDSKFYVGLISSSEFLNLTFPDPQKEPIVNCRCNVSSESPSITWFSVSIIIPVESIVISEDFRLFSLVLDNFFTALLVFFVLVALIIILMWGHRLDRMDEKCRSVIIMEDNYPGDGRAYVVAVFTGQGIGSGTTSRVAIRLFGEKRYSRVHILNQSNKRTLTAGRDDWFLMTSAKYLGRLKRIQMWHDHSGISPEWYCKKISIFDLRNRIKYDFIVERWFTFDVRVSLDEARMYEGNAATPDEVSKKWYLLVGGWMYSEMREKHHLASIFRRHPRSLYTRCQRVIISVTFLMTTMLVSMMFFKLDEVGPADWPVIPFKWRDVWSGVKSSLISSLINMGVVICFGIHKKYERKSLSEAKNFEVTNDPNESEPTDQHSVADFSLNEANIWWRCCMPHPIQYRPVVLGIKRPERKTLSLVFLSAGWIFATLTIAITSFFVILYGLKFGPKKSMVWALTFLTGAFSNGIIFAPLKMVILGIIVALTFKKSYLDAYTMQIKFSALKLAREKYMERLKKNFRIRLREYYKPCPTFELKHLRSTKLRGREYTYLLTHTVMLVTMFSIALYLSNLLGVRESYYHIRQLREVFMEGKLDQGTHRVWDSRSMYQYFTETTLPALHHVKWYSGKTLAVERSERAADPNSPRYRSQVKGFVKDYSNKLLGIPSLRQLRLSISSSNDMKVPRVFKRIRPNALGHYSWKGVDQRNYLPPWVPYDGYHGILDYAWIYQSPEETETGTTTGYSMIQYSGGGYVIPLSWNLGFTFRRMKYLEMNEWVTNRTRCIFLEINLFNNNVKHFAVIKFIVEALPSGMYWNRPLMEVATMHIQGRFKAQAILFLVTFLLVLLLSYTALCVWHMSRDGLFAYLATWRGLSDLVLICAGFLTVSSQYNLALHYSLVNEYLDKQPRDRYTSLFSPLNTKNRSNEIFCSFCLILLFNMGCTLFKFKLYAVMNRVLAKVYKLAIAAGLIMNFYDILIVLHSFAQDTELGKLLILQFSLREEIFHNFNHERKIFHVLFTPVLCALFKFHVGYIVSAHATFSEDWRLPTFLTWTRFKHILPKPLPRRRKPSIKPPAVRKHRKLPEKKTKQKKNNKFQLIM